MAVENVVSTKLKVELDNGTNDKGIQLISSKSFANINETATADGLYAVGSILASFSSKGKVAVKKIVETELSE